MTSKERSGDIAECGPQSGQGRCAGRKVANGNGIWEDADDPDNPIGSRIAVVLPDNTPK